MTQNLAGDLAYRGIVKDVVNSYFYVIGSCNFLYRHTLLLKLER